MSLEQVLRNLPFIGSGAFSMVYDLGNGNVIKVPKRRNGPDDSTPATLLIRQRICRDIYEATTWLNSRIGDLVTPVDVIPEGALIQRKLDVFDPDRLPKNVRRDAYRRINEFMDSANEIIDSEKVPYLLDLNCFNFALDSRGRILGWFDPFVPGTCADEA